MNRTSMFLARAALLIVIGESVKGQGRGKAGIFHDESDAIFSLTERPNRITIPRGRPRITARVAIFG